MLLFWCFCVFNQKADNSEDYHNIATVPSTDIPVTTKTINGATDCPSNINYFGGFIGYHFPSTSPTNFNGQTKILKAESNIEKEWNII